MTDSASPYKNLPATAFWKTGVSEQHPLSIQGLYRKKFELLPNHRVATAGSCFAQHIATHLRRNGYRVVDAEPAPPAVPDEVVKAFGYGLYSARYGNIYTARQLLQLAQEALEGRQLPDIAWRLPNGRFVDALRPSVEPEGLATEEEVRAHREAHLEAVAGMLKGCEVFVFTLGLTEAWESEEGGTVFPTAPGTIAGTFDPTRYRFVNYSYNDVFRDFIAFRRLVKSVNRRIKFILTVSPVPLTATRTDDHVLAATVYSKSTLRAVAGDLSKSLPDVDYFPSYEIIASHFSKGFFFDPNLRTVNPAGVENVMRVFFAAHPPAPTVRAADSRDASDTEQSGLTGRGSKDKALQAAEDELICEEALLEAFSR